MRSSTPIDTSEVTLSDDLAGLTERLAAHIHETWAQRRRAEGWTYGAQRDDAAKTHPGLVPYAQLAESEKEYDRQTAIETIRSILALGYRIVPPGVRESGSGS
jgi:hypothetical protein